MFRKITFALAAATVVGAAAIPTTASAHWTGWRHGHYAKPAFSVRIVTPYYAYAPHRCFTKKRWKHTRWGWKVTRVRVCR